MVKDIEPIFSEYNNTCFNSVFSIMALDMYLFHLINKIYLKPQRNTKLDKLFLISYLIPFWDQFMFTLCSNKIFPIGIEFLLKSNKEVDNLASDIYTRTCHVTKNLGKQVPYQLFVIILWYTKKISIKFKIAPVRIALFMS